MGDIKMSSNERDHSNDIRSKLPIEARLLFGRAPVLSSESKVAYWSLVEAISTALDPQDIVEWIIVKTVVDLVWNMNFYQLVKAGIIDVKRRDALKSILRSLLPEPSAKELNQFADGWFKNTERKSAIIEMFIEHKIEVRHIDAEAVRLNASELLQIEHIIAGMETRLRNARRDIEIYREGKRLREEQKNLLEHKKLPFIPASELSDDKQDSGEIDPNSVIQPSQDKEEAKEDDLNVGNQTVE